MDFAYALVLLKAVVMGISAVIAGVSIVASATKSTKDDEIVGKVNKFADFAKRVLSLK